MLLSPRNIFRMVSLSNLSWLFNTTSLISPPFACIINKLYHCTRTKVTQLDRARFILHDDEQIRFDRDQVLCISVVTKKFGQTRPYLCQVESFEKSATVSPIKRPWSTSRTLKLFVNFRSAVTVPCFKTRSSSKNFVSVLIPSGRK